MIERTARRITEWMIKCEVVKESEKELYVYAAHSFILTLLPVVLSLILGLILKVPINGILIILPFTAVRKYSGGFHASKEAVCLICSSLLILLCIFLSVIISCSWIMLTIAGISAISLICFSPIENDNRILAEEEQYKYKRTTAIIAGGFFFANLLFFLFNLGRLSICISIGVILPALLQVPCIITKLFHCKRNIQ